MNQSSSACQHSGTHLPENHLADKPSAPTGCSHKHNWSALRPIKADLFKTMGDSSGLLERKKSSLENDRSIVPIIERTLVGKVEDIFEKKIFELPISYNKK